MLKLTTLGGLSLTREGAVIGGAAAQRSRLALVALLARSGQAGVPREKLLLLLWPESDTARARHALKQAIYSVRRELGDEDVIVGSTTVALNPALIESDVALFEAAIARGDDATAVELYAGPFLDGVHIRDSVEFERWSADQRAQLAHAWADAVARLARQAEARGDWRAAAALWRRLASAEPLSAGYALALLRALGESGDTGAALQHFRVYETLCREELDSGPDPEVQLLADGMRAGTWQRSPSPAPSVATPVEERVEGATSVAPVAPAIPAREVGTGDALAAASRAAHSRRRSARFVITGITALALGLLGFRFWTLPDERRALLETLLTRGDATITPRLIVVAPLSNNTGDSTLAPFGEHVAEWVATSLNEAGFTVIDSRTARYTAQLVQQLPRQFRSGDHALALARETGAETVILGNYYLSDRGDSLRVHMGVVSVPTGGRRTLPLVEGPRSATAALATAVARRALVALEASGDTSAGGMTANLSPPPSMETFRHVSRAWELFFVRPADTLAVFRELDRAMEADTMYAAPLLMRAYVLAVKQQWPGVEAIVRRLRPRRDRLSRVEHAALDLFEADLRGDLYERLDAARTLMRMSPRSTEMTLLVVLSSLYVGRPDDALSVIGQTDPTRGMNLISPTYWEWRSTAEHFGGHYAAEFRSTREAVRRFPASFEASQARVRALATAGDVPALERVIAPYEDDLADPVRAWQLRLYAARELRAHAHARPAADLLAALAGTMAIRAPAADAAALRLRATVLHEARHPGAADAWRDLLGLHPDDLEAQARIGALAARSGAVSVADSVDRLIAARTGPFLLGQREHWRAHIAAARGQHTEAAALLRTAVANGYRIFDLAPVSVHIDGDFVDLVRSAPYAALLKELRDASLR